MGFAPQQLVAVRENKQLRPESPGICDNRFGQCLVIDIMKGPRIGSLQRKNTRLLIQVQVELQKLRKFKLPNGSFMFIAGAAPGPGGSGIPF